MIDENDLIDNKPTPEQLQEMLLAAFKENNEEKCLELLKEDVNPIKEDKEGWSPLLWASFHGNEKLVKILL